MLLRRFLWWRHGLNVLWFLLALTSTCVAEECPVRCLQNLVQGVSIQGKQSRERGTNCCFMVSASRCGMSVSFCLLCWVECLLCRWLFVVVSLNKRCQTHSGWVFAMSLAIFCGLFEQAVSDSFWLSVCYVVGYLLWSLSTSGVRLILVECLLCRWLFVVVSLNKRCQTHSGWVFAMSLAICCGLFQQAVSDSFWLSVCYVVGYLLWSLSTSGVRLILVECLLCRWLFVVVSFNKRCQTHSGWVFAMSLAICCGLFQQAVSDSFWLSVCYVVGYLFWSLSTSGVRLILVECLLCRWLFVVVSLNKRCQTHSGWAFAMSLAICCGLFEQAVSDSFWLSVCYVVGYLLWSLWTSGVRLILVECLLCRWLFVVVSFNKRCQTHSGWVFAMSLAICCGLFEQAVSDSFWLSVCYVVGYLLWSLSTSGVRLILVECLLCRWLFVVVSFNKRCQTHSGWVFAMSLAICCGLFQQAVSDSFWLSVCYVVGYLLWSLSTSGVRLILVECLLCRWLFVVVSFNKRCQTYSGWVFAMSLAICCGLSEQAVSDSFWLSVCYVVGYLLWSLWTSGVRLILVECLLCRWLFVVVSLNKRCQTHSGWVFAMSLAICCGLFEQAVSDSFWLSVCYVVGYLLWSLSTSGVRLILVECLLCRWLFVVVSFNKRCQTHSGWVFAMSLAICCGLFQQAVSDSFWLSVCYVVGYLLWSLSTSGVRLILVECLLCLWLFVVVSFNKRCQTHSGWVFAMSLAICCGLFQQAVSDSFWLSVCYVVGYLLWSLSTSGVRLILVECLLCRWLVVVVSFNKRCQTYSGWVFAMSLAICCGLFQQAVSDSFWLSVCYVVGYLLWYLSTSGVRLILVECLLCRWLFVVVSFNKRCQTYSGWVFAMSLAICCGLFQQAVSDSFWLSVCYVVGYLLWSLSTSGVRLILVECLLCRWLFVVVSFNKRCQTHSGWVFAMLLAICCGLFQQAVSDSFWLSVCYVVGYLLWSLSTSGVRLILVECLLCRWLFVVVSFNKRCQTHSGWVFAMSLAICCGLFQQAVSDLFWLSVCYVVGYLLWSLSTSGVRLILVECLLCRWLFVVVSFNKRCQTHSGWVFAMSLAICCGLFEQAVSDLFWLSVCYVVGYLLWSLSTSGVRLILVECLLCRWLFVVVSLNKRCQTHSGWVFAMSLAICCGLFEQAVSDLFWLSVCYVVGYLLWSLSTSGVRLILVECLLCRWLFVVVSFNKRCQTHSGWVFAMSLAICCGLFEQAVSDLFWLSVCYVVGYLLWSLSTSGVRLILVECLLCRWLFVVVSLNKRCQTHSGWVFAMSLAICCGLFEQAVSDLFWLSVCYVVGYLLWSLSTSGVRLILLCWVECLLCRWLFVVVSLNKRCQTHSGWVFAMSLAICCGLFQQAVSDSFWLSVCYVVGYLLWSHWTSGVRLILVECLLCRWLFVVVSFNKRCQTYSGWVFAMSLAICCGLFEQAVSDSFWLSVCYVVGYLLWSLSTSGVRLILVECLLCRWLFVVVSFNKRCQTHSGWVFAMSLAICCGLFQQAVSDSFWLSVCYVVGYLLWSLSRSGVRLILVECLLCRWLFVVVSFKKRCQTHSGWVFAMSLAICCGLFQQAVSDSFWLSVCYVVGYLLWSLSTSGARLILVECLLCRWLFVVVSFNKRCQTHSGWVFAMSLAICCGLFQQAVSDSFWLSVCYVVGYLLWSLWTSGVRLILVECLLCRWLFVVVSFNKRCQTHSGWVFAMSLAICCGLFEQAVSDSFWLSVCYVVGYLLWSLWTSGVRLILVECLLCRWLFVVVSFNKRCQTHSGWVFAMSLAICCGLFQQAVSDSFWLSVCYVVGYLLWSLWTSGVRLILVECLLCRWLFVVVSFNKRCQTHSGWVFAMSLAICCGLFEQAVSDSFWLSVCYVVGYLLWSLWTSGVRLILVECLLCRWLFVVVSLNKRCQTHSGWGTTYSPSDLKLTRPGT